MSSKSSIWQGITDGITVENFAKTITKNYTGGTFLSNIGWAWANSKSIKLNTNISIDVQRYSCMVVREGDLTAQWQQHSLLFIPSYTDAHSESMYLVTMTTGATAGEVSTTINTYSPNNKISITKSQISDFAHTHSYFPLAGGTVTGTTTFNEEVKMIKTGSSDICNGVACDFKSNRSQISNLVTNYIYLGKESTDKNIRFRSYSSISSASPSSPIDLLVISSSGCTASNFITNSDIRLKTNIKPLPTNSKSLELNFYEFDYVNNDNHSAGHFAQEVKETLPEFVHGNESETEHLSIDYTGLHSVQIKALKDEVDTLKTENKELRERLEKLEALLEKLV